MPSRLIIIGIKTVLFIGLSTITVATAYGYRLDTAERTFERTGILDVEFAPADARLFVDGREVETSRGKQILSLPLGSHRITITHENFKPFEKIVDVEPDLAIRFGTIYLVPLPVRLSAIGQTNAVQEFSVGMPSQQEEYCVEENGWDTETGAVILEDGALTLNGRTIASSVGPVLEREGTLLFASEFSLQEFNGGNSATRTVHRFTRPVLDIDVGPSDDYVFVATSSDVSLCNVTQALCTHVLHSPGAIRSTTYHPDAMTLDLLVEHNQHITIHFPSWKRSLFGL
jgi:hypothetical protein